MGKHHGAGAMALGDPFPGNGVAEELWSPAVRRCHKDMNPEIMRASENRIYTVLSPRVCGVWSGR
jgi:hypothetical protein